MELAYALLGGVIGAILGSLTALALQRREYDQAKRSAGRAVCLEAMQNAAYAKAAIDGMPVTLLPRAIFDRELNLIAALLGPEEFRHVTAPYLRLTATNELLGPFIGKTLAAADDNVREAAELAELGFRDATTVLSLRVWSKGERAELFGPPQT